jgi:hypothetical protein
MTLSMFVKGKVNFKHVHIWFWVCLSKKNLTLDMFKYDFEYLYQKKRLTLDISKYDFEYICERKSWLQTSLSMTLNMFVKGEVDFYHVEIWFWVCLSKEKLALDMTKYDFEYNDEKKTSLYMFVKGKVDFKHVEIWLWVWQ